MENNNGFYSFRTENAIAMLSHKYTHTKISVYEPMSWIKRKMIEWCFGFKYEKIKNSNG